MKASTLEGIAKDNKTVVKNSGLISQENPMLAEAGYEPSVVGAMSSAKLGAVVSGIEGNLGVYAIAVDSREVPKALPSYENSRKNVLSTVQTKGGQLIDALKEASNIKDYRANVY